MADTYPKNTIDDNGLKKVWDMVVDRLGLKVDKEAGKGLSTNDYTTTEKNKLAGIANGAEVNTVTSVAGKTGAVTLNKSDVGLGNVGNFKAVSTSANQGLTDTEKSNSRANIDTPSKGDIQSSKALKSSVVTVNDAAPINAEDITVDITPIQDLHGYDRPWAGGAGKNKCPMTVAGIKAVNTSGTWSGNAYSINNGTVEILTDSAENVIGIKFSGNFSSSLQFYIKSNIGLPSGSYKLNGGISRDKRIYFYDGSSWYDATGGDASFTITSQTTQSVAIVIPSGQNNDIIYPMIRLSTETDSTFAPYSNECPIEGWTGAELDRVGKNKLPMTLDILKSLNTGGTWSGNIYSRYGTTFTVLTNSDNKVLGIQVAGTPTNEVSMILNFIGRNNVGYILSGCPSGGSSSSYRIDTFGTGVPNTPDYGSGATFTASGNSQYVRIIIKSGYAIQGSLLFYPMIRLATETDSTYEPYQGQQYTASFGETVYGGKWHVTKGGTDNETGKIYCEDINFGHSTSAGGLNWYDLNSPLSITPMSNLLSYKSNPHEGWYSTVPCLSINDQNTLRIYGTNELFATGGAYEGAYIVYELATPTTISTPKQNVPMLQGINTVSADCGDTQLKYQPDNVIGELKGEIRAVEAELAEVEENLEIVYEDHVANTSMGIIVDGYSVGDVPFSNALDIAKTGYTPIAVTDTSIVHSTVATQGEIATHCLLDVANNRVRFYVHVMDSAASLTIPPNSLTFRVAYKKA